MREVSRFGLEREVATDNWWVFTMIERKQVQRKGSSKWPRASLKQIPTWKEGQSGVKTIFMEWQPPSNTCTTLSLLFLNTWEDLFGKLSYKLLTPPHASCLTAPFLLIKYIHSNMYHLPDRSAVSKLKSCLVNHPGTYLSYKNQRNIGKRRLH